MLLNVKNGKYSINNSKSEDVCLLCFPSNSQVWYGYKGLYSTQIKRLYLTVLLLCLWPGQRRNLILYLPTWCDWWSCDVPQIFPRPLGMMDSTHEFLFL